MEPGGVEMPETIGFIGLGGMGSPIAANLIRAGYRVRVFNRTPDKAAPLVALGAMATASPDQVVEPGGVVLSMVADDAALESLCTQSPSFIEKLGPNGVHISVSTVSPATVRRLAGHHAKFGVTLVSSPVFGRPEAAAAARLWVCLGGPAVAKTRALPILKAISQGIFDFGEDPAAANVIKLCGNFLIASALESLAEATVLAEKNGVPGAQFAEMMGKTLFACPVYQNYSKQIAEKRFEPAGFRLALGLKDINLVLQTAASVAMPMPVASLLRDRWIESVAKGREGMDWSAIALAVAEDAGFPATAAKAAAD
jgi:3-hydroxyisobutyrate dehydrogenase-like beta-hydroxyacid dehydrogenase